jgi:hypothetical protein
MAYLMLVSFFVASYQATQNLRLLQNLKLQAVIGRVNIAKLLIPRHNYHETCKPK